MLYFPITRTFTLTEILFSIDDGNSIDMSPLKTKEIISTDYNSPFLTITFNDGSSYDANLSSLLNTDNQTLSTTNDSLIISNGNAIPLSSSGSFTMDRNRK